MGKKRVAILGDFESEEKIRQQKAIERQQKKLREGKKLSKSEIEATNMSKQARRSLDELDSNLDPVAAMREEMSRLKQEREKTLFADTKQTKSQNKVITPARTRSPKYHATKSKSPRTISKPLAQAIEQIKSVSYSKFDGSIELHINLKKKESFTSTTVQMPHATGQAKKAVILDDKIIKDLESKKINFDILYASPDQMKLLVPFAKLLGPRGLMPNPKNGTLTPDPKKAVSNYKPTSLTIKTEPKAPIIHTIIGKTNMETDQLVANLTTALKAIDPKNITNAYLSATISPSAKLDLNQSFS